LRQKKATSAAVADGSAVATVETSISGAPSLGLA
jgi:hypothetical protein